MDIKSATVLLLPLLLNVAIKSITLSYNRIQSCNNDPAIFVRKFALFDISKTILTTR